MADGVGDHFSGQQFQFFEPFFREGHPPFPDDPCDGPPGGHDI
nr:hypothetical protein OH826_29555 [Streptomyces sp. NBC_00899]